MKRKTITNPKCVIYVRISMARDNQTSTKTQESECRAYAERNGWEVIAVNIDEGKSAWKGGRRPALDRTMEMIETKRANIALVWKLDRFARSIIHFHELMGRIQRSGGIFASVTDNIDGSTTQGQIMMGLVAGFAQMESDIKSERAAVWQKDRIADGLPNGGQRAYGYQLQKGDTLAINEKEADTLREIATRILDGESIRSLVREYEPQSVTGSGPMSTRGLRSALTNPTVAGLRRNDDEFAPGNWDAILPREQWDALNTLFGDPTRRTGTTNQVTHLLSGIIECDRCGNRVGIRKWKANPTKRNPYFQESHRYTCKCGNSIDQVSTDNVIMRRLWEIVTPQQWQEWRTTGKGWDESVIDGFRRNRESVLQNQILGKVDFQWAEDRLAEIDRAEAIAMGDEPLDLPDTDDPRSDWDSLSVIDRRKIIAHAFEGITLNESNGCRNPDTRIATVR